MKTIEESVEQYYNTAYFHRLTINTQPQYFEWTPTLKPRHFDQIMPIIMGNWISVVPYIMTARLNPSAVHVSRHLPC